MDLLSDEWLKLTFKFAKALVYLFVITYKKERKKKKVNYS